MKKATIFGGLLALALFAGNVEAISFNVIEDTEQTLYFVASGTGPEYGAYSSHWSVVIDFPDENFTGTNPVNGEEVLGWGVNGNPPYRFEYMRFFFETGQVGFAWWPTYYVETKVMAFDDHGSADPNDWSWSLAFFGTVHEYGYPTPSPFGTTQVRSPDYPIYNAPDGGSTAILTVIGFSALHLLRKRKRH
jgi:hypothetical protein